MKSTQIWDVAISHSAPSLEKGGVEYTITFMAARSVTAETLALVLDSLKQNIVSDEQNLNTKNG